MFSGGEYRRVEHRKDENNVTVMYAGGATRGVFVAINLNNITCVGLKSMDAASLICQQGHMKVKTDEILREQATMQLQPHEMTKFLISSVMAGHDTNLTHTGHGPKAYDEDAATLSLHLPHCDAVLEVVRTPQLETRVTRWSRRKMTQQFPALSKHQLPPRTLFAYTFKTQETTRTVALG